MIHGRRSKKKRNFRNNHVAEVDPEKKRKGFEERRTLGKGRRTAKGRRASEGGARDVEGMAIAN